MAYICSIMRGSLGAAGVWKTSGLWNPELEIGKAGQWKGSGGGTQGCLAEHHGRVVGEAR